VTSLVGAFESQNARAWDNLARDGAPLARPATDADFVNPLGTIDPAKWLGASIQGWRVLCLAAGGGRQSALYAAAGSEVTVLDISREMLALDAEVARERKLNVRIVEGTMTDLSMFAAGEFDLVIQPVSTCYVPDVVSVYQQVARVVRGGGLYVSQHKSPVSLQVAAKRQASGYTIEEPYYRMGPLAPAEPSRIRERGATEYLHRWEELIGGLCRAGFVIEDLLEPMHAKGDAEPGTFAHRAKYIAPYVRIKARRTGGERNLLR
jgi:SAM-dependent methyltransferase